MSLDEIHKTMYYHIHRRDHGANQPKWRGVPLIKLPSDLILYEQVIHENRPDVIIETGTAAGGSALFYADMLTLFSPLKGKVISIDVAAKGTPEHMRVTYVAGSSVDDEVVEKVKGMIPPDSRVMIVLDSNHNESHVTKEIQKFSPLVSPGQFLVVEDAYIGLEKYPPLRSVQKFLAKTSDFVEEDLMAQFLTGMTRGGWLRRVK